MGDSLTTIIVIFLAAILMFIVPMMSIADRSDDISNLIAEISTVEFVDNVRSKGKLSQNDYDKFYSSLGTTGSVYEVELKVKILDENSRKKITQNKGTNTGNLVYYEMFTSQILDTVKNNGVLILKEGDIFSASAKNSNLTISQQLQNFFYTIVGSDMYSISGKHAGVVTLNGN